MASFIRIYEDVSKVGLVNGAYFLKDTQLKGSPPTEQLKGLFWRCMQAREFAIHPLAVHLSFTEFLLKTCAGLREAGLESYLTAVPPRPFGQANQELSHHLDCADWIWDKTQQRWMGAALNGDDCFVAPLFSFWLEQALRWSAIKAGLGINYHDPRIVPDQHPKANAALYLGHPTLNIDHLRHLPEVEREIFTYALSFCSGSHGILPRPQSLPPIFEALFTRIATRYGIGAFETLWNLDPACRALSESWLLEPLTVKPSALVVSKRL